MSDDQATRFTAIAQELTRDEMRYRGYDDEQITRTETHDHNDRCEYEHNTYSWICEGEDGNSYHPIVDELDEIAGIITRALESRLLAEFAYPQRWLTIPEDGATEGTTP